MRNAKPQSPRPFSASYTEGAASTRSNIERFGSSYAIARQNEMRDPQARLGGFSAYVDYLSGKKKK